MHLPRTNYLRSVWVAFCKRIELYLNQHQLLHVNILKIRIAFQIDV